MKIKTILMFIIFANLISPAKMTMASQSTMDTDAHVQTVTRKEQQFARPHIKIPKLFRSNPYRLLSYINNPEDGTFVCDDDLLTAYRHRRSEEHTSELQSH